MLEGEVDGVIMKTEKIRNENVPFTSFYIIPFKLCFPNIKTNLYIFTIFESDVLLIHVNSWHDDYFDTRSLKPAH